MSNELSSATPPAESRPKGRIRPPIWYWLFLLVLIGLNFWARMPDMLDHAIANLIGMGSSFAAIMVLVIWFAFFSGHSAAVRWTPLAVVVGGLAFAVAILRVDHTTAELLPVFAFRWSKQPDQLLAKPVAPTNSVKVALDVSTDDDFPQFLGPDRNLGIDRIVLARDWKAQPPRPVWKHPIGAGHSAFSAVNGYAVTMEQRDDEELVTCYDLLTGDLKWSSGIEARHTTIPGGTGPRSTPTIYQGKVYAMGASGVLRCLDGANGSILWSKNLLEETGVALDDEAKQVLWGRAGSPLVVDNLVVVPGGGPKEGAKMSLIAYDMATGKRMWQAGDRQVSYSSPSLARLDGVRQIVSVNENNITGHNVATGAMLWEYPWPGSSNMNASSSQAIAVADDRLFVSKGYSGGGALFSVKHDPATDRWATETIWHNQKNLQTKLTNVVVYKGFVYGLSDGILECVELATGKRRWKAGHYGHGQILRVGDLLLVESDEGEIALVELSPEAHHELGKFEAIEGQTWNNLCLFGRYLLVRNSREAACYELPLGK
ncbi:MAG TPA: PQQ-binding-like beta-propeller repeat protein [Pirellulales bacterium]|jgi:outer membrane protein assembly factor BamB|nr:PQQ-binding-like beta-propeller repeat protein [Pirellulales bacterium]